MDCFVFNMYVSENMPREDVYAAFYHVEYIAQFLMANSLVSS